MPENLVSSSRKIPGLGVACVVGKLFCFASLAVVFFLACGGASASNRDILRSDVLLLKQENRRLREEMAVLDSLIGNRLQHLDRFNANFAADVRQLNERMSIIKQRLDDIEKKLTRVAAGTPSAATSPAGRPGD